MLRVALSLIYVALLYFSINEFTLLSNALNNGGLSVLPDVITHVVALSMLLFWQLSTVLVLIWAEFIELNNKLEVVSTSQGDEEEVDA
jgi:hypothetical protein